ncbi:hypothetical protein Taro_054770 [Colocasia esculenta]|uniref:Uncharacterized protein n=1 Tax=Colocasia esculenta TaxID=4460 RepID=A0A843XS68_COLES|nr:hypothetical protein [Colocasia esculenta]
MRSRCDSPRHGSRSMELESPCRLKEEPQLSGAYIRSLVKHLSSSMPKGAMNPKPQDGAPGVGDQRPEAQQEQQQDQKATPLRKQTRRRVCTSKPYQERLINMAEARREIVTALKFHRAAMKRASEQQQREDQQIIKSLQQEKPPQQVRPPPPPPSSQEPQRETTGRDNPSLYPSCGDNLNMLFSYLDNPYLPSTSNYPPNSSWPCDNSLASLPISGNLIDLTLPSRPLGLNLNLQDFNSIDINLIYSGSSDPPMLSSTSSPSYSHSVMSPMITSMPALAVPSASSAVLPIQTIEDMPKPAAACGRMLHPAMGDEEIAEIRSIGEQHDMEWNDKLSLDTTVWWCNLLETMEVSPQVQLQEASRRGGGEGMVRNGGLGSSDEVMEMPSWLSDQQQVADDYYCSEYLQDASLPW